MKFKSTYREGYKSGTFATPVYLREWAKNNCLPPPFAEGEKPDALAVKAMGKAIGDDGEEYEYVEMVAYVKRRG